MALAGVLVVVGLTLWAIAGGEGGSGVANGLWTLCALAAVISFVTGLFMLTWGLLRE